MVYEVFESVLSSEKLSAQCLHKRRRLFNNNLSNVFAELQVEPGGLRRSRIHSDEQLKH